MQRTQRLDDATTALEVAMRGAQGRMWTALPGIIQSFDAAKMTCSVQPALQGTLSDPKTGKATNVNLPLLVDCPVQFPSGGGVTLTLPIAESDECLIIFASRCIDAWWQNGGIQPPMVYRMHDLSDGYVIPGIWSQPRVLSGVSTSKAQLRSTDGSTMIELDPDSQRINLVAPGGVYINGIKFDTHKHTGVQTGSGISGGPQ